MQNMDTQLHKNIYIHSDIQTKQKAADTTHNNEDRLYQNRRKYSEELEEQSGAFKVNWNHQYKAYSEFHSESSDESNRRNGTMYQILPHSSKPVKVNDDLNHHVNPQSRKRRLRKSIRVHQLWQVYSEDRHTRQIIKQAVYCRSIAWIIFRQHNESALEAQCRICGQIKRSRSGNTTTLLHHIDKQHIELKRMLIHKTTDKQEFPSNVVNLCSNISIIAKTDENGPTVQIIKKNGYTEPMVATGFVREDTNAGIRPRCRKQEEHRPKTSTRGRTKKQEEGLPKYRRKYEESDSNEYEGYDSKYEEQQREKEMMETFKNLRNGVFLEEQPFSSADNPRIDDKKKGTRNRTGSEQRLGRQQHVPDTLIIKKNEEDRTDKEDSNGDESEERDKNMKDSPVEAVNKRESNGGGSRVLMPQHNIKPEVTNSQRRQLTNKQGEISIQETNIHNLQQEGGIGEETNHASTHSSSNWFELVERMKVHANVGQVFHIKGHSFPITSHVQSDQDSSAVIFVVKGIRSVIQKYGDCLSFWEYQSVCDSFPIHNPGITPKHIEKTVYIFTQDEHTGPVLMGICMVLSGPPPKHTLSKLLEFWQSEYAKYDRQLPQKMVVCGSPLLFEAFCRPSVQGAHKLLFINKNIMGIRCIRNLKYALAKTIITNLLQLGSRFAGALSQNSDTFIGFSLSLQYFVSIQQIITVNSNNSSLSQYLSNIWHMFTFCQTLRRPLDTHTLKTALFSPRQLHIISNCALLNAIESKVSSKVFLKLVYAFLYAKLSLNVCSVRQFRSAQSEETSIDDSRINVVEYEVRQLCRDYPWGEPSGKYCKVRKLNEERVSCSCGVIKLCRLPCPHVFRVLLEMERSGYNSTAIQLFIGCIGNRWLRTQQGEAGNINGEASGRVKVCRGQVEQIDNLNRGQIQYIDEIDGGIKIDEGQSQQMGNPSTQMGSPEIRELQLIVEEDELEMSCLGAVSESKFNELWWS